VTLVEIENKPTQIYRHFSKDGKLIYVGTSLSAVARLSQHKNHSPWFNDIRRVEVETFATRKEALEAEQRAIQKEQPAWNIHHKKIIPPPPTPTKLEKARQEITHRVVTLNPVYNLQGAATVLDLRKSAVVRLIENGELGYIELPAVRDNGRHKPQIRITGWQLLDYIESRLRPKPYPKIYPKIKHGLNGAQTANNV